MDMFETSIEKKSPGRPASGDAKAPEPKLHELPPGEMSAALKVKEFFSKGEDCTKVQVSFKSWPYTISVPVAELATTGLAVIEAVCVAIGPGRKGQGYDLAECTARLLRQSRLFSDGTGFCAQTQAWSPALAVPKGQDATVLRAAMIDVFTKLAEGIEAQKPSVLKWVETRKAEGIERKTKATAKREAKKAAKLKAEAEAKAAE